MPELPEIESLKIKISPKISNEKISEIKLRRKDLRFEIPKEIIKISKNQTVKAVKRRSKYLIWNLENGKSLIFHLGMSGRLFFSEKNLELNKHDHVLIDFKNGMHLRFRDPRRFGMFFWERTESLSENKFFRNLGVEPLEESFDGKFLYQKAKASNAPIKTLIMNAKHVVGIGNIYANEALFLTGVRPYKKSSLLSRKQCEVLSRNIKKVLLQSIKMGGTSFKDFVGINEEPGLHKIHLNVYGRELLACKNCKTKIKKIVQAGRSSFYCPNCQK